MKKLIPYVAYSLLIVYFLYAIAPLSYDAISGQTDPSLCSSGGAPKIVKLYAVDALFYALFDDEEKENTAIKTNGGARSSHDHILLNKKRALCRSMEKLIAQLSVQSSKRLEIPTRDENIAHTAPVLDAGPKYAHDYHAQHSGTSPPFV